MISNSKKTENPPTRLSGTDINSPLFSWKDCFSASFDDESPMEDAASEEQNQQPLLPTGEQRINAKRKIESTPTIVQQTPFRDQCPLSDIRALPSIFDPSFQSLTDNSSLGDTPSPQRHPSFMHSASSDSETSCSFMRESPSLSPISPDDTSPPPQKKLKRETLVTPTMVMPSRSMFHIVPNTSHQAWQQTPSLPAMPSYRMMHDNDLMRELNELPTMFNPADLPCILPGENGEEQIQHVSPRLAPTEVEIKKEKQRRRREHSPVTNPQVKSKALETRRAILSGKRQSRKKTNVACTNCVRAKAGCDQGRPCSRCTRLGKPNCVDRPINTRRRRKIARRFTEEVRDCSYTDVTEDVFKPSPNEFIIGSYNGDVDGYIDYYMGHSQHMAQVPNPMQGQGYNPMRSPMSAIPLPPKLPPIPSLNAMAPQNNRQQQGVQYAYYGQTSWAMSMCPNPLMMGSPTTSPMNDSPVNAANLYGTESRVIRDQDLDSPTLSAMDMSKPSHTTSHTLLSEIQEVNFKQEMMRPSTTTPFKFRKGTEEKEYVAS